MAAAADVYTWVDEDGVTHFSDAPPAAAEVAGEGVETLPMPRGFPEPVEPDEHYYSIANQWQRMQAERAEKNKLALERQRVRNEQRALEEAARQTAAAEDRVEETYVPVVYGGGFPGHGRFPQHRRFKHTQPAFSFRFGDHGRVNRHKPAPRRVEEPLRINGRPVIGSSRGRGASRSHSGIRAGIR